MNVSDSSRFRLSGTGRLILVAGVISMAAAALVGCFPSSSLVIAERDVVITVYEPGRDFANYMTYVMPDSVVHIENPDDPNMQEPDRTFDAQMLADVARNMLALGWIRDTSASPTGADPDVAVFVSATSTSWIGWTTVPCNCWGWWPGWGYYPGYPGWGPGWGWGYPPLVSQPYEFNTGTVFVEMTRPQEASAADMRMPVIWSMALNGVIENSQSSTSERLRRLIDQGFTQSPYLGDGK